MQTTLSRRRFRNSRKNSRATNTWKWKCSSLFLGWTPATSG